MNEIELINQNQAESRYVSLRKPGDICIVNQSEEYREIVIRDHALVRNYNCQENNVIDLQALAFDIYFFCVNKGAVSLLASFIPHPLELDTSEAIFLAYPRDQWNVRVRAEAGSEIYFMQMQVSTLHKLINPAFDEHHLESVPKVNMRDLMKLIPINPALMMCFDQLIHHKMITPFREIFEKAKFLEIFSLLMESSFGQPMEACPVMMSPAIEIKLQQVRRHIIQHLDETPDPDQLSVLYELPRNTLREGYRYVYGKTIHQYHTDHKLESAMQMLTQGELLVKEVAFKIGYQNPSHFISAFKKRYGYTPKKYLKREISPLA